MEQTVSRNRERYYSSMDYEQYQQLFDPESILFKPKEDPDVPPPLDLGSTASESPNSPTIRVPPKCQHEQLSAKSEFTMSVHTTEDDWAHDKKMGKRVRSLSESIPCSIYWFLDREIKLKAKCNKTNSLKF